jgi:peptidoglycan/xylan/chitin deacetylase (PgdA/CDA1 family)
VTATLANAGSRTLKGMNAELSHTLSGQVLDTMPIAELRPGEEAVLSFLISSQGLEEDENGKINIYLRVKAPDEVRENTEDNNARQFVLEPASIIVESATPTPIPTDTPKVVVVTPSPIVKEEIEPTPSIKPSNEAVTPSPVPTNNSNNEVIIPTSPSCEPTQSTKEQTKKMVALSYDDGPSKTLTPELLEILKDNDCTATFFVLGCNVKQYSDIIYEVYSAGNEIGNHSYDHSRFTKLSEEDALKQIERTNKAIYEVTNEYPTFFRPPYGAYNNEMKEYIEQPLVTWSIDSNDWRKISDEQVINNIIPELEDGKIILMHDVHRRTIEISKIIIPKIKEMGYDIVSISELCEAKNVEPENGHVYSKIKKR